MIEDSSSTTPRISLIAAMGENRVIGRDGRLPWDLPDEMKHFRDTTRGCPLVMGRKTFQSMRKALPGRHNIVVTRDPNWSADGVTVAHDLNEALQVARQDSPEEIMVIGGAEIYRQAQDFADRMYLTVVHGQFEGDTYFPDFDEGRWNVTQLAHHPADERHAHAFTIYRYDRH